jgi:hypothetical protein
VLVAKVVRMPVDDSTTVLVEVSDDGVERVGRVRDVAASTAETLQQAVQGILPAVDEVLTGMRGLAQRPEKVKLEFGIKLSAEAGVLIARASTEAQFKVTLEWSGGTAGE